MNEKIKRSFSKLMGKGGTTWMFVLGLIGILLISLSGLSSDEKSKTVNNEALTNEEYCAQVESKIRNIVKTLTGDENPSVAVTLDTGIKYIYADETKQDTADNQDVKGENKKTEKSDRTENNCVIIENSDGGQTALKITEYMPTVRGVTVICNYGNSPAVTEKIKNAVMTALDITSKRVFVTGR